MTDWGSPLWSATVDRYRRITRRIVSMDDTEQPEVQASRERRSALLLNVYIAALAALALILFGWVWQPLSGTDWMALLIFVAVATLSEALSTDIVGSDTFVTASVAPLLAATFIVGPVGALAVSLIVTIHSQIKHRATVSRFIFNLSNHLVSSLLVAALLAYMGQPLSSWSVLVQLPIMLGAALLNLLDDDRGGSPLRQVGYRLSAPNLIGQTASRSCGRITWRLASPPTP